MGVRFKSLQENNDTTGGSKLVFHIFGAFVGFDREVLREHTKAGLQAPEPEAGCTADQSYNQLIRGK